MLYAEGATRRSPFFAGPPVHPGEFFRDFSCFSWPIACSKSELHRMGTLRIALLFFCLAPIGLAHPAITPLARAEVGDVTLRTDHPQYAGEGAFQTIEDCVQFALEQAAKRDGAAAATRSPQDRAIAVYNWLLTHQWHLRSPQEFLQPGEVPDTERDNQYESMVFDANRGRFSYGYGLCGTVHAWNEPYWKALGMNARRRAFPGHTNSEIEYGGGWHAFDTDMAGLIFRADGVVAGYADVARDFAGSTQARPPLPCYPFAWPGDYDTMLRGWREVARGGHWFPMYHSGYAGHPGVVHLRSGETFTRYFDPDHFGGPAKRRFWHHEAGGPSRDWTFAGQLVPHHEGAKHNSRNRVTYANGEFVYRPNLASEQSREGLVQATNLAHAETSPRLRSAEAGSSLAIFGHFSPYVICGDPADDANPMTGPATGGLVVTGRAMGEVQLAISTDQGQTWQDVAMLRGEFSHDVTDLVKGRYGWQARFAWNGDQARDASGLDEVSFTTVTQVCQAIYPRLAPGGSEVSYRAASHAVVPVLPNWAATDESTSAFEERSLRSANVVYAPRSREQRFAYRTTNNKPGQVVFRIDSPTELTEVSAAVRFGVRVPPPPDCDFHMELSLDDGQSWKEFARAEIPADNEYSSGWMYGRTPVDQPDVRKALVRAHFYQGGHQAGLIDAQLYVLRRTSPPQASTITYAWREGNKVKQHQQPIAAGTSEMPFRVPTGEKIVDEWVRIAVE
jgi:hypothetical protein